MKTRPLVCSTALLVWLAACTLLFAAAPLHPLLDEAERQRLEVVKAITPATIAVFDQRGEGGGSGVIVRADGLVVTNFHVVAPCGPFLYCGLPDGTVVPAVVLGVDPPGDL
ncbi:MAG: trypsin-like peptidase domain-containing protein, partial [Planctomycetales bacterium]|nr:trypsin-like peptidase domain-containing protein [Planctomycetales bacterium]